MTVYRFSKRVCSNFFGTDGTRQFGGRWSSIGTPVLYTCDSKSLAFSELTIHVPLLLLPEKYFLISILLPENIKSQIAVLRIPPKGWNYRKLSNQAQQLGDKFMRNNTHLCLQVPSAIINGAYNYLLNPAHPDFKKLKVGCVELFATASPLYIDPKTTFI
jgi:RES domain-containing protein